MKIVARTILVTALAAADLVVMTNASDVDAREKLVGYSRASAQLEVGIRARESLRALFARSQACGSSESL
ncbi:MAG: hypothetical protein AAF732_14140 [Pseudomonadota bacterium]